MRFIYNNPYQIFVVSDTGAPTAGVGACKREGSGASPLPWVLSAPRSKPCATVCVLASSSLAASTTAKTKGMEQSDSQLS